MVEYLANVGGRYVELPMLRQAGDPPPCGVCPKVPADAPAKHWRYAADFEPWFWEAREWYLECRAVGDFGRPDPLMRAVAAEFDQDERRAAGRADTMTAALLARVAAKR